MGYAMKTNLAHKSNYGTQRNTSNIQYVVMHYTGNDGDSDEANANYFKGANRNASAHYFVDDDSVTCSVPDDYVAWSVGGSKWGDCWATGGGRLYGTAKNSNSLSIEICDTIPDGRVYPSDATINNAADFAANKLVEYGLGVDRLIRHFDVNGKHCPDYGCITEQGNLWWFFFVMMVQERVKALGGHTNIPAQPVPQTSDIVWSDVNENVRIGQQKANEFVGHHQIAEDGVKGPQSIRMKKRVLQHAMNLDYHDGYVSYSLKERLDEDGEIGNLSRSALSGHYIKRREKQYLVTAMEIIAYINGFNPNGVEFPGIYGADMARVYNTDYINEDGILFCTCG